MERQDMLRLRFYREELFNAKNQLFRAKNLRKVRFLQDRINFLQKRIMEIENNGKSMKKFG